MMMIQTKYEEWYSKQSKEFKKELTNGVITKKYEDHNFRTITLEELKELDKKFC